MRPTSKFSGEPGNESRSATAIVLSVVLHAGVLGAALYWMGGTVSTYIVAAGPGEGGQGGGGSIEVGIADPSEILGFARPQPVSFVGDQNTAVNNMRVETSRPPDQLPEALLPATEREASHPDAAKTKRPVINQQERVFTGSDERGGNTSQSVQVGRSFGSPTPQMSGGVGIGRGEGFGGGTGLPGGSAYGRVIRDILGRNFNPPAVDAQGVQYVIIRVRISRDGRILSIVNGRVAQPYIRQRSSFDLVNKAAERALLASDPLPAFPAGFLTGAREATAEVWFRYPK